MLHNGYLLLRCKTSAIFRLFIALAFSIFLIFLCAFNTQKQSPDEKVFEQVMALEPQKNFKETTKSIALFFEGRPYKSHTLESESEHLICNLREFDCATFVENVLALSMEKTQNERTFTNYQLLLQRLRYRNGEVGNYDSRIHYFSEWIFQQQKNGILRLMSKEWGGLPYEKKIRFMTQNREKYPALSDEKTYQNIKKWEEKLDRLRFFYIPKANILDIENQIEDMDLLVFTATDPTLDVTHEGFAIKKNGRVHLLHASSDEKKVRISAKPLYEYVQGKKAQSGIMVARFNF